MAHRYRAVPIQTCLRTFHSKHVSRFCSNHTVSPSQMARDSPCAIFEKVTIAHTFRVREISSLPDLNQYGSSIHL